MSQENVEFIRGLLGGAADLDKQAILAVLPDLVANAFTDDAEWIEDPSRADQQIWRGHDGICESWRNWLDQFDEYAIELVRVEDHGDQVFAVGRERARGNVSGADVVAENYTVFTFRDGRISRYEEFYDEAAARAAIGGT